jgi:hypothetical protein
MFSQNANVVLSPLPSPKVAAIFSILIIRSSGGAGM